jgi:hypothetical protein
METVIQLRMFDPAKDHAMIMQWCVDHGHVGIPANVLPKLGVVAQADGEDIAALWLYMDNSTGVCFAEYPITKAGLSVALMTSALRCALDFLKQEARINGYWIMRVFTIPPLARLLKAEGFRKDTEGLIGMACPLLEDTDGH